MAKDDKKSPPANKTPGSVRLSDLPKLELPKAPRRASTTSTSEPPPLPRPGPGDAPSSQAAATPPAPALPIATMADKPVSDPPSRNATNQPPELPRPDNGSMGGAAATQSKRAADITALTDEERNQDAGGAARREDHPPPEPPLRDPALQSALRTAAPPLPPIHARPGQATPGGGLVPTAGGPTADLPRRAADAPDAQPTGHRTEGDTKNDLTKSAGADETSSVGDKATSAGDEAKFPGGAADEKRTAPTTASAQGVGSMALKAGPPVDSDAMSRQAPVQQAKPQQQTLPEPEDLEEPNANERRQARRRPAAPSRDRIAANDDVPSIGGLIYALNQRPSKKPFAYAGAASAVWILLVAAYAYFVQLPAAPGGSLAGFAGSPWLLATLATALGPIALFWFLAALSWRAEELHLRSTAMTEVAVRLAEPDRMAEQSVASLGQAVRRQVSFMNDAVSRALGRAGELEALVHNEVSSLEQSYEENERKIRALINELSGERNALMNTGQRFQHTLQSLGSEVPAIIERLNEQQLTLAKIIEGAADNLTSLETAIGTKTGRLESSIDERTTHLNKVLEDYTSSLSGQLGQQSQNMQAMLGDYTTALGMAFESRTKQMHGLLESGRTAIDEGLQEHQAILDQRTKAMQEHSKQIAGQLEAQRTALDQTMVQHGEQLAEKSAKLTSDLAQQRVAFEDGIVQHHQAIEAQTRQITSRFDEQKRGLQDELSQHQAQIEEIIGDRTQTLQTVFEAYARALDSTLANRAQALDAQLVERTKALDDAFGERLRLFDESILRSTSAIDDAVGQNAKALTSAMEEHAQNISRSLAAESGRIDETLMAGINAVRATSENVTQQSLKAIEGLAGQADLLRNVSENLLGQISSVASRFENQGQAILRSANALENANSKIDRALQQRNLDLNETLDRMSGKAEELGRMVEGYSTSLEGSLSHAQNHARMITEELSRDAQERSRAALEDIARLKSATTIETDKALSDLRAEFANVSKEVTERLGSLGSQFSETSGEVRQQAARAAEQLEHEQKRLREQLHLLPSATEETSSAMRKALQDQLRALDKLTELASRTTSSNEASPGRPGGMPLKSQALPPPPQQDTSAHGDGRGRDLTSLTSTLARELSERQGGGRAAPAMPPRSAPATETPTAARAAAVQGGDGRWSLGDLLARASEDEAAGQPRRQNEPAAAGSQGGGVDIGRLSQALDAATAATIWSRFRNGHRGFMVASIYAPESRPLFAQAVQRYASDAAFKANVDRFLAEFERGLHELDQRDPSRQSSDAQIATDTGRIYLVLAHAANRLA